MSIVDDINAAVAAGGHPWDAEELRTFDGLRVVIDFHLVGNDHYLAVSPALHEKLLHYEVGRLIAKEAEK